MNAGVLIGEYLQNTVTVASYQITGGGLPTNLDIGTTYADTLARHLGLRLSTAVTLEDVETTNLYGEHYAGTAKVENEGGAIQIVSELLEGFRNDDLVIMNLSRNPNYYGLEDGEGETLKFIGSIPSLRGILKIAVLPNGSVGSDATAIENCLCIQINNAVVDPSSFAFTGKPLKEKERFINTITFKAEDDPDDDFSNFIIRRLTVDATVSSSDGRYCNTASGIFPTIE